jgi:hypothetical protein
MKKMSGLCIERQPSGQRSSRSPEQNPSGNPGLLNWALRHETGHYLFANFRVTGYLEDEFHHQVTGLLGHEPNIGPQQSFPRKTVRISAHQQHNF